MCYDGAGWHTSKSLVFTRKYPNIITSPYSPELNPTEHIWEYIREQKKFNNYTFKILDAVEDQLEKSLRELNDEKNIM